MARVPELSAIVVFRPRDGRSLSDGEPITSESVAGLLPDAAAVERVQAYFRDRGFAVSEPVAISFSIAGPRSRFEEAFGADPALDVAERVAAGEGGGGATELDMSRLPPEIAEALEAVAFTPPPDFGPTAP